MYLRIIKTKEVLVSKEGDNFIFPFVNGSVRLAGKGSEVGPSGRIRQEFEAGEEHRSDLQGETDTPDSAEQQRAQDELEAKLHFAHSRSGKDQHWTCHKKSHFPSHSSKLMLSGRQTQHWTFCRNVRWVIIGTLIGARHVSGPWSGFTQLMGVNDTPPQGYTWSGGRLTKIQARSSPKHIWPGIWSGMSRKSQQKEKQYWAEERPKLDNAGKLRGI